MLVAERQSVQSLRTRAQVVVNGRFRTQNVTGVQRYAAEIVARLSDEAEVLVPLSGKGAAGHLWEQTLLPWNCEGRLLWSPNACGPLLYRRQVVTFHDLFPIENPEWYSTVYARWYGLAMRRLAAGAMHLIAVSEYTKSRLVKVLGCSPENVTVIPNGCHVGQRAHEDQIGEAAAGLKLPGRRYVLSLGSLERRKNVPALLQAWSEIQAQLPSDLWLVIAGSQPDAAVYGELGSCLSPTRVFYTGYVPEQFLSGLYSGAELFVFPSLAEGFGLPLLEAMACGVRCLSSSSTSLPEVGGEAVRYFDPACPGDLARALGAMLLPESPAWEAGGYRPSVAQARRFSWDAAASKTRQVIETHAEAALQFPQKFPRHLHESPRRPITTQRRSSPGGARTRA